MLTFFILFMIFVTIPIMLVQSFYRGSPVRAVLLNTYKNKNVYEVFYKRGSSEVYTVRMGSDADKQYKELVK